MVDQVKVDENIIKRSMLLGARIRFSPAGASIRTQAIQRILEQNLAVFAECGLTEEELKDLITLDGKLHVLSNADVREGLTLLKQSGRLREFPGSPHIKYALSIDAQQEVSQTVEESVRRIKDITAILFKNVTDRGERYEKAFLKVLCFVFARLTDLYVNVITTQTKPKDFADHTLLCKAVETVLSREDVSDKDAFKYGIRRFFQESSPLFDQLKWNLAQNFYVSKALGLDSSADLLSVNAFKAANLYCDTNVLIAAFMPSARHHRSFTELAQFCDKLGMSLRAAYITLEELRNVIYAHSSLIRKNISCIPEETQPKVRSFLLEEYLRTKKKEPDLDPDSFLGRFEVSMESMKNSLAVDVDDDSWFEQSKASKETKQLANEISKQYEILRKRPKWEAAAIHDALLFLWVDQKNRDGQKSWIVTLDLSFIEWNAMRGSGGNVITLDALLQWIMPLITGAADEEQIVEAYSLAISYQILPRDVFFDLRDFQIFAEMGIEARNLPAEDVEACIGEIKRTGPYLDPGRAEDREKMAQVIQRYFADPAAKYKKRTQELQTQSDGLREKLNEESKQRQAAEHKVAELERMSRVLNQSLEEEKASRQKLEKKSQEKEKKETHNKLVRSIVLRSIGMFIILLILEAGMAFLSWKFAEGTNLLRKINDFWVYHTAVFGLVVISFPFVMGKERMQLFKWWKGEND